MKTQEIYCCGCKSTVIARLTGGVEIYPHRPDLQDLPFWKCDVCQNYVGCHHKTKDWTRPLGNIPTPEIKTARQHIHKILDPLWQNHPDKFRARGWIYRWLAGQLEKESYHTGEIANIDEARKVYALVQSIKCAEDCRPSDATNK